MGKTLRRYVLGEVLGVLFLGVLLTTFVLATVEMVDLVDLAFAKGVAATRVLAVFGYMIPSYLELTLPMALLLSIVAAFARLSRDGEVIGMRAAGLSLGQLARPLFGFAVFMAFVSFGMAGWASPWANRNMERAITEMAKTRITAALTPGVFSPWVDDIVVYVGEIERRSGHVQDVMLADERDRERPRTIFAEEGRLITDNDARMARFRMREGTILTDYANPTSFDRTDFKSFDLNVGLGTEDVEASASFMDEPRRMDWKTLLEGRAEAAVGGRTAPEQGSVQSEQKRPERQTGPHEQGRTQSEERNDRVEREIEIQRRLAVPFSCVLLPLIGVPLGVQRSRAVRSRGIVVGLAVILVYYFLITAGVTLAHQGVLGAAPALWAPNGALLVAGVVAFRRAGGERLARARAARVQSTAS